MLILIFKCATDRTTKTKWWSLTSLVLWAFDFWSQGLWRSQFKITNTPHLNPPPSYWAWFRSRLTLFRSSKVSGKTMLYPRKSNLFHSCAGLSCIYFLLSCPYLFRCQNVDLLWLLLDQLIPPHQAQVFGWKGTWTNWLPMSEFVLCLCKPGEEVDENLANPRSHLVSCRGAEVDI